MYSCGTWAMKQRNWRKDCELPAAACERAGSWACFAGIRGRCRSPERLVRRRTNSTFYRISSREYDDTVDTSAGSDWMKTRTPPARSLACDTVVIYALTDLSARRQRYAALWPILNRFNSCWCACVTRQRATERCKFFLRQSVPAGITATTSTIYQNSNYSDGSDFTAALTGLTTALSMLDNKRWRQRGVNDRQCLSKMRFAFTLVVSHERSSLRFFPAAVSL